MFDMKILKTEKEVKPCGASSLLPRIESHIPQHTSPQSHHVRSQSAVEKGRRHGERKGKGRKGGMNDGEEGGKGRRGRA